MSTASPSSKASITALQKRIWSGSLPLEIRLSPADCRTYDDSDPYLITAPRLSYLPHLLPRLHNFFQYLLIDPSLPAHSAWLSFDSLQLKWHYPLGLLHDLFSGRPPAGLAQSSSPIKSSPDDGDAEDSTLPWRLVLHYSSYPSTLLFPLDAEGRVLRDAFVNAVKEAGFIRHATSKHVMSLSEADGKALWTAVEGTDLEVYKSIERRLMEPDGVGGWRAVPLKIYLPTARHAEEPPTSPLPSAVGAKVGKDSEAASDEVNKEGGDAEAPTHAAGSVRVVQGLVSPVTLRQITTMGMALNALLPTVFPSRRNPVLACPVLHGAVVPMNATLEELGKAASYADGFLHVVVVLLS